MSYQRVVSQMMLTSWCCLCTGVKSGTVHYQYFAQCFVSVQSISYIIEKKKTHKLYEFLIDRVSNMSSSYQHHTHQLFGQPLLVPVPRNDCTYDTLYNCVLNRMS